MRFDNVIGNPPYQSGNDSGNFALWPKFISLGNRLLNDAGHLMLIVPQTWAGNSLTPKQKSKETSLVRSTFLKNGHLKLVDFTIGRYFNVGSTFSLFNWQKNKNGNTVVRTEQGDYSIDNSTAQWIPIIGGQIAVDILNKTIWNSACKKETLINNGSEISGFRSGNPNISNTKTGKFRWPIVNTSAQYTNHHYLYSTVKHDYQNYKKVIFSCSGYEAPFYDCGEFGIGHHSRAIIVESKKRADAVVSSINSKLMRFIAKTKPDSGSTSPISRVQNNIIHLDRKMTDDEIYKYFRLTQLEINLIESLVK